MERTEYIPKIKVDPTTGNAQRESAAERPQDTRTIRIPEQPASREAEPASLTAQYAILKKIGDGGMGVVYLARDRKLGRYVAIKRLNKTGMTQATLKERFQREAKAIAILNHIHIVHVYALDEDHDGPYIVMEYIAGPRENAQNITPPPPYTLADRVHKEGPFSLNDAININIKLCSAVEYAHSCGVIHRDLKPSNVLLDESREPKLVDFGLARQSGLDADHLTVPGEKMLSLGYGAPEQETDASTVDERADVYGLGALLYFSITGQNPRYFRENDLPEALRVPLVRALKTDRSKRWNSVGELKASLMLIAAPSTIDLPTSKTTWRCKWCDTINPVATPHCSGCGWDGRIFCAECGAETRFGIQFCGVCGADGKEYEQALRILDRLLAYREEKAFDKILENSGAISGFIAAGVNGQKIVSRIRDLEAEARKLSVRRDQLRDLVTREMAGELYADAARHIQEYRELSQDRAFSEEERALPGLVLQRDLKRAGKAMAERNWSCLKNEYLPMLFAQAPDNPEARRLLDSYRNRQRRFAIRDAAAVAALAVLVYVLSAAPLSRLVGSPTPRDYHRRVFKPVAAMHANSFLRRPLEQYAALWGAESLYAPPPAPPAPEVPAPAAEPEARDPLAELRRTYEESMAGIESNTVQRLREWPATFTHELTALQDELQRTGDFEGWSAVKDELLQFESSGTIPTHHDYELPSRLLAIRDTFQNLLQEYKLDKARQVQALANAFMDQLAERQKQLTMEGKMDEAKLVNAEIKRVKSSEALRSAETVLEAQKARETADKTLQLLVLPDSPSTNASL